MCGLETALIKRVEKKNLDVAEMKMLRWMYGLIREDRVRNEYISGPHKVVELSKKVQEARLRWFGHVMRSNEEQIVREAMDCEVQGRTRRRRPKLGWKDGITANMMQRGLSA